MNRLHMVRGSGNYTFYAIIEGYTSIVKQIHHHPSQINDIVDQEIFRLQGERIVALEIDVEQLQDELDDKTQALYVLSNKEKIYYIKNIDGKKFQAIKVIDFSYLELIDELQEIESQTFSRVFITMRTLTMLGKNYNLETDVESSFDVPNFYFY